MNENKSNKGLIITLIIIIVIMFFTIIGLSFSLVIQKYKCNMFTKTVDIINNTADKITDSSTSDKVTDTIDKIFDVITKQTDNGFSFPYIDFDSEDAEDINDDIEDFYDDLNTNGNVMFKTYSNGDIQSIVIKYNRASSNTYKVYNINKKTGKKVTAEELMKSKNMTLDNIKIRMKAIWMQKVKKSEGYSMPTESNKNISVENATKENIDKLSNNNIVLYLNSEGHLCVIYQEYQIAGSETGFYIMDLDKYLYTELK